MDTIVVGYSGSDDFDVMACLNDVSSDRRVVWLQYAAESKASSLYAPPLADKDVGGLDIGLLIFASLNYRNAKIASKAARPANRFRIFLGPPHHTLLKIPALSSIEVDWGASVQAPSSLSALRHLVACHPESKVLAACLLKELAMYDDAEQIFLHLLQDNAGKLPTTCEARVWMHLANISHDRNLPEEMAIRSRRALAAFTDASRLSIEDVRNIYLMETCVAQIEHDRDRMRTLPAYRRAAESLPDRACALLGWREPIWRAQFAFDSGLTALMLRDLIGIITDQAWLNVCGPYERFTIDWLVLMTDVESRQGALADTEDLSSLRDTLEHAAHTISSHLWAKHGAGPPMLHDQLMSEEFDIRQWFPAAREHDEVRADIPQPNGPQQLDKIAKLASALVWVLLTALDYVWDASPVMIDAARNKAWDCIIYDAMWQGMLLQTKKELAEVHVLEAFRWKVEGWPEWGIEDAKSACSIFHAIGNTHRQAYAERLLARLSSDEE